MPKVKRKMFVVEGTGRFPIDMLRHDSCWPYTSQDTHEIETRTGRRTVTLLTDGIAYPTYGRWQSFLWPVVQEDDA